MGRRSYELHSVLGQGGFGRVYRATLHADGGFRRDVAVKLLLHEAAEWVPRFRDEARILGLIRDRAFVQVDPPFRLGGRWAIAMELVDGESATALLRRGPLPLTCALEVVAEVARALDGAFRQPGPDGRPLEVLHRDLKPSNLHLTRAGDVRILDLGIAKASFVEREAVTSDDQRAGTRGYVAPERFDGVDTPAGDVFSLGVVLHVLVTRERPVGPGAFLPRSGEEGGDPRDPRDTEVLALARRMMALVPEGRPAMGALPGLCRELAKKLHAAAPYPTLAEWAATAVRPEPGRATDELCGHTWPDEDATAPTLAPPPTAPAPDDATLPVAPRTVLVGAALGSAGVAAIAAGAAAAVLALGVAAFSWSGGAAPTPAPEARPEAPAPSLAAPAPSPVPAEPSPVPAPPAPAEPPPVPVKPSPMPTEPPPAPVEPPPAPAEPPPAPAEPPPAPPEPSPAPAAPAATFPMSFLGAPGLEVYVDGQRLGAAPVVRHPLPAGRHAVELRDASGPVARHEFQVGPRLPTRIQWAGARWSELP